MTRRVIKPQPPFWAERGAQNQFGRWDFGGHTATQHKISCGYESRYQVGEAVYIKEAIKQSGEFAYYVSDEQAVMFYRSLNRLHWRWKKPYLSPRALPEEAARYFIKITDIRAERLQEITWESCKAEGVGQYTFARGCCSDNPPDPRWKFIELWDSINPKYPWESNPFVFVYSFKKAEK